jgi:hypothetical protein
VVEIGCGQRKGCNALYNLKGPDRSSDYRYIIR